MLNYKNYDVFLFSKLFGIPSLLLSLLVLVKLPEISLFGYCLLVFGVVLTGLKLEYQFDEKAVIKLKKIYCFILNRQDFEYDVFDKIKVDVISTMSRDETFDRTNKVLSFQLAYRDKKKFVTNLDLIGCIKSRNRRNTNKNAHLLDQEIEKISQTSGLLVEYTDRYQAEMNALVP